MQLTPPHPMPVRRREVTLADPLRDESWDQKLAANPAVSFFHRRAWARVLHETYGFRPLYFVRSGKIACPDVVAVMEVDSWATGRRGVSLPFSDTCPPLCADAESFNELIAAISDYGRSRGWKHCELRGGIERFGGAVASTSYYGHSLDLLSGEPALFAGATSAARRAVRKAEKSAVAIEFAHSIDAVRRFYELLCRTRRRLGAPPQPFSFFAKLHQHVLAAGQGCIVLAHSGGLDIAGAVFVHSGNKALYKFGASDERYQHLRGNNLVMWRAIEWHARAGFHSLDFGRTSVFNRGLRDFKTSWGATEHPIDYVRFDCKDGTFLTHPDRTTGWHARVFQVLPSRLARIAGSILYRHVA